MKLLYFFLGFIFLGLFIFWPVKEDGKYDPRGVSGKILTVVLGILGFLDFMLNLNGVLILFSMGIVVVLAEFIYNLVNDYNNNINKIKQRIVITGILILIAIISFFIGVKYESIEIYFYCIPGIIILGASLNRMF